MGCIFGKKVKKVHNIQETTDRSFEILRTEGRDRKTSEDFGLNYIKVPLAGSLMNGEKVENKPPIILCILDASGSMSGCWAHLANVINYLKERVGKRYSNETNLKTLTFDDKIRDFITGTIPIDIKECGGGGTNFINPFKRLDLLISELPIEQEIKVIFASDGGFNGHSFDELKSALKGHQGRNLAFFCLAIGSGYPTGVASYIYERYQNSSSQSPPIFKVHNTGAIDEFMMVINGIEEYLYFTANLITVNKPVRTSPMSELTNHVHEGTNILTSHDKLEFQFGSQKPVEVKAKEYIKPQEMVNLYSKWTHEVQMRASIEGIDKNMIIRKVEGVLNTIKVLNRDFKKKAGIDLDANKLNDMFPENGNGYKIGRHFKDKIFKEMQDVKMKLVMIKNGEFFLKTEEEKANLIAVNLKEEERVDEKFKSYHKEQFEKVKTDLLKNIRSYAKKPIIKSKKKKQSIIHDVSYNEEDTMLGSESQSATGDLYNDILCIDIPETQDIEEEREILESFPAVGNTIRTKKDQNGNAIVINIDNIHTITVNFETSGDGLRPLGREETILPLFTFQDVMKRKEGLKTETFNKLVALYVDQDIQNASDELYFNLLYQVYSEVFEDKTDESEEIINKIFYSLKMMNHYNQVDFYSKLYENGEMEKGNTLFFFIADMNTRNRIFMSQVEIIEKRRNGATTRS